MRIRLLLLGAVALIAGAVWLAGERQHVAADRAFAEIESSEAMLTAMLDQESGLMGYVSTRRKSFLRRYESGRRRLEAAIQNAQEGVQEGDADEQQALTGQRAASRRFSDTAEPLIAAVRVDGARRLRAKAISAIDAEVRAFRALNSELQADGRNEREDEQRRAELLTVGLIALLATVFGGAGYVFFERRFRRDTGRRERQSTFTEVLQLARTESEAYQVVKRHLERLVPTGVATVLNRNNSANRLEASSEVSDPAIASALDGAEPEDCMAIRAGRTYTRAAGDDALISCEVCGSSVENVTCVPSLVGGEVIGSVLVQHPRPMSAGDVQYLSESIAESSPIIANLRNLAIAELRAATDALTGLPNNRALQETLKRMAAQSGRTMSPLAVLLFDLDRFKQINDTHGHSKGDEVLAAVGDVVGSNVRASDVVGRYGGEEFLALLPDTDRAGAVEIAEKLRQAISELEVSGVSRAVTASFGVAVLPDEAGEPDELVRVADRALYTAKAKGRDRVEVCAPDLAPEKLV